MAYLGKIKRLIGQIFNIIFNRLFIIFTKVDTKKVLFLSDVRKDIGEGNLSYMNDYLPSEYKKVYSFSPDRRVKRSLKEYIKLMYNLSTSGYILLDDFSQYTSYLKVRKNQELVQLWHGPGAYKKFGHSRGNGDLKNSTVHPGYKRYTKAIVTAEDIRPCFADAYSISIDKVQATGFPRTDLFFDKEKIKNKKKEVYNKYPYLKNKKVILFAPTYRGTKVGDAYYDLSKLDIDKLYKKYKDEYVFLIKWHPAFYNNIKNGTKKNIDYEKYNSFIYDLSEERDINDLLLITDILITDYSSVIFDYVLVNKPIILYTYDLKDYEGGRGLYFPFEEYVYGSVCKNMKELVEAIDKKDMCNIKRKTFVKKFMSSCDGNSTKKTFEWVFWGKK